MAFNQPIASTENVKSARVDTVKCKNWQSRKALLIAVVEVLDTVKTDLPAMFQRGTAYFTLSEDGQVKVNPFLGSGLSSEFLFAEELRTSDMNDWKSGIKKVLEAQEKWQASWEQGRSKATGVFKQFGRGSAGRNSESYGAAIQTAIVENLQCVACAARQEIGHDISYEEFAEVVNQTHPKYAKIKSHCFVSIKDGDLWADETKFKSFKHFYEMSDAGPDWVESSAKIANAAYRDLSRGKYNFYRQDQYPRYKGYYNELKSELAQSSKTKGRNQFSSVNTSLLQRLNKTLGISEDKWNPSDIIAVKTSFESKKNYRAPDAAKALSKDKINQDTIQYYNDLAQLYEYNKWIHDQFENGNVIGISLKKAGKSVKREVISSPDIGTIASYKDVEVKVTDVKYLESNAKCLIYFDVSGFSDYNLDARGFEESGKVADIQIQLMKKDSTAAHGKVTLPATEVIAKLSSARRHFTQLGRLRKRIFGENPNNGFMPYPWVQSKMRTQEMVNRIADQMAEYIHTISNGEHSIRHITNYLKDSPRVSAFDKMKYVKNKIQSYEIGYMLDTASSHISESVQQNIVKSMYFYAGSKAFMVFNNQKATVFMQSSSYIKFGG
jgi:hypothetical protein